MKKGNDKANIFIFNLLFVETLIIFVGDNFFCYNFLIEKRFHTCKQSYLFSDL